MIFGILKPNLVMTDVEKIFITVAHERQHEAYVFVAKNIDFENKKIVGQTLQGNHVIEKTFDFPHVVQNRLAVKQEDMQAYLNLAEMVPFTSNRIGDKNTVYKIMSTIDSLKKYLIEVLPLTSLEILLDSLEKHKKIICKPASSNQGKGIVTIEKNDNTFMIKQMENQHNADMNGLIHYYNENLTRGYTVSPFLKSETCLGQSTVFRMHLTRGAGGKWQKIKFFPYVNLNKAVDITNGMLGALITTREQLFLEQFYPTSFKKINQELKVLFTQFTQNFQKKFAWRLDSIGLDLGITQEGDIYIYEVNVGPGVGFMAYPVACAQVEYYEWLVENTKPPYQHNFLPINLRRKLAAVKEAS